MYHLYILKYAGGALYSGIMTDSAHRSGTCNYSKLGVKYVSFRRSMGFLFLQKCIFSGLWQVRMRRGRGVGLLVQEKAGDYKSGEACLEFKERKIYARFYRAMLVRCFF